MPVTMDLNALVLELMEEESVVLHTYRDTRGFLTIGVGHNIDANGLSATPEDVKRWLENDIAKVESELDIQLPWWRSLSDIRQRVVVDMAFNMGTRNLLGFNRMLRDARVGVFVASDLLESLWARQVGRRAIRLAKMWETNKEAAL